MLTPTNSIHLAKMSAQSLANSTTLTDDLELNGAVEANCLYLVSLTLPVTFGTVSQIKIALDAPTGTTNYRATAILIPNGIVPAFGTTSTPGDAMPLTAALASSGLIMCIATLSVGADAGNIKLRFAQNASSATPVTVQAGASMTITKL